MLLLLGSAPGAFACSCVPAGPPCQEVWAVAAVFSGKVDEITSPDIRRGRAEVPVPQRLEFPVRRVRLSVDEAWRGLPEVRPKQIEIETGMGGGDCGYPFERGERYLIYAYKSSKGALATGICTRTRPISQAAEDLNYLRSLAQAKDVGEIRVWSFDVHRRSADGNEPLGLAGVRLRLSGPGGDRTAETDDSGRHVFSDLPSGQYTISAERKGYIPASQPPPVTVGPRACAEIRLPMRTDPGITGMLRTKDGGTRSAGAGSRDEVERL